MFLIKLAVLLWVVYFILWYFVKNSLNTPATSPQLGEYYVIRLDAGAEQEETLSLKSVTQEIKE